MEIIIITKFLPRLCDVRSLDLHFSLQPSFPDGFFSIGPNQSSTLKDFLNVFILYPSRPRLAPAGSFLSK